MEIFTLVTSVRQSARIKHEAIPRTARANMLRGLFHQYYPLLFRNKELNFLLIRTVWCTCPYQQCRLPRFPFLRADREFNIPRAFSFAFVLRDGGILWIRADYFWKLWRIIVLSRGSTVCFHAWYYYAVWNCAFFAKDIAGIYKLITVCINELSFYLYQRNISETRIKFLVK